MEDENFTPIPCVAQLPTYVRCNPAISESVIAVRGLVEKLRLLIEKQKANQLVAKKLSSTVQPNINYELEVRMRVSDILFENILASFLVYDKWVEDPTWVTIYDIYHKVGDEIVRTSRTFHVNGQISEPEHMMKKVIDTVDLDVRKTGNEEIPSLRVQLSSECAVEKVPDATKQTFARIKNRKVFRLQHYAYHLTITSEGADMEKATANQKNDIRTFEIEIELEKPEMEIAAKKSDDLQVATNLMLKVFSPFLAHYGPHLFFEWKIADKKKTMTTTTTKK